MARRYRSYSPWDYEENFPPYVPVGVRREKAARAVAKLNKQGKAVEPVAIEGRDIATSFWGKAWCDNLEAYSDFENRLPRGRTYLRNGAVVDLQLQAGLVTALVQGTDLYEIEIKVKPLPAKRWKAVVRECQGGVASLVELLRGKLSDHVMQVVTRRPGGLFPTPAEIQLDCSCPDGAMMCKHIAAALYGVGARLDHRPELLFVLRAVEPGELVSSAAGAGGLVRKAAPSGIGLQGIDLSSIFGVDIVEPTAAEVSRTLSPDESPKKTRKTQRRVSAQAVPRGKKR